VATFEVQGIRSVHECDAEKRLRTVRDPGYGRTRRSRQRRNRTPPCGRGDFPSGVNAPRCARFFPVVRLLTLIRDQNVPNGGPAAVGVAGRLHYYIGISIRYVFASLPETGHQPTLLRSFGSAGHGTSPVSRNPQKTCRRMSAGAGSLCCCRAAALPVPEAPRKPLSLKYRNRTCAYRLVRRASAVHFRRKTPTRLFAARPPF
jgi:hypothetical protein